MDAADSFRISARWRRLLVLLLQLVAAVFLALYFIHLRADFPNGSPWMDWAKMTDEGWYAGAAVHHFTQGRWFLPGSFNPAVAMPFWSVLSGLWFTLAGFGMVQLRVLTVLLFGGSLLLLYALVRRASGPLCACSVVVLIAVNPYCYAFDRLAVLEPVMVFLLLLGLWLAGRAAMRTSVLYAAGLGVVAALLLLTKISGIALVPALLYHLWETADVTRAESDRRRSRYVLGGGMAAVAAVIALAYYLFFVRPRFLADYRLLFRINGYRIHLSVVPVTALQLLRDGLWMDKLLWPLALLAFLLSLFWLRSLWRIPLFGSAVLAAAGYLAFIGYHGNLQPRYFLLVEPWLAVVIVLTVGALAGRESASSLGRVAVTVVVLLLAADAALMGARTLHYVATPEYSFASAGDDIARIIRANPCSSPLLLSAAGDDISLFTGVPALAEYSTIGFNAVVARYQPGWFAGYIGLDDPEYAQLATRYVLRERAHYRVFDDPTRQTLVLYQLVPRAREPVSEKRESPSFMEGTGERNPFRRLQ